MTQADLKAEIEMLATVRDRLVKLIRMGYGPNEMVAAKPTQGVRREVRQSGAVHPKRVYGFVGARSRVGRDRLMRHLLRHAFKALPFAFAALAFWSVAGCLRFRASSDARSLLRHLPQPKSQNRRRHFRHHGPLAGGQGRRCVGASHPQIARRDDASLGMPKPDPAAVNSFVTFLETSLDQAALAAPNPGTVSLHRLNRAEYQNAMQDVLGVEVDAAALLPRDDISNGLDNIANVLKVSPSFLDQYIAAAREVSRLAISHPPPTEPVKAVVHGDPADAEGLPLGTQGGIVAKHLFPFEGDYSFTTAGPYPILTIDGLPVSTSSGFVHVKAGMHEVALTSPAHSFAEADGMLQSFIPGRAFPGYGFAPGGAGPGGRRAPSGPSIEIIGPYHTTGKPVETQSRARIFVCKPPSESEEASCANRILSEVARRAFRRPVTAKDLVAPMAFFKQGRADSGNFEGGIQNGIIAILASPKFLYRAEPPPAGLAPGTNYRLSDLELASRLSFFLWSTVPDDELLAIAEQGKLKDPKVFDEQVRRMLASERSRSLVTNFALRMVEAPRHRHNRSGSVHLSQLRSQPSRGFPAGTRIVRRQHPARGPQRLGSSDGQLHVRERAASAPLRYSQRARPGIPACDSARFQSLRLVRERGGFNGDLLCEPHLGGAAR